MSWFPWVLLKGNWVELSFFYKEIVDLLTQSARWYRGVIEHLNIEPSLDFVAWLLSIRLNEHPTVKEKKWKFISKPENVFT